MAKHRRPQISTVRTKPVSTPARPAASIRSDARITPVPAAPRVRYLEAVALYEQGVTALQEHDYARASSVLRSVLARYPEEKELHERVRLYLNVCERHMAPRAASPSTPEERVFAATLALNAGNYDEAHEHLIAASQDAPEDDQVLYMLASVLTLRDELEEAAVHIVRAIELNPDNRSMASHDPDLEPLRQYESVRAALDAPAPPKPDRRKPARRSR